VPWPKTAHVACASQRARVCVWRSPRRGAHGGMVLGDSPATAGRCDLRGEYDRKTWSAPGNVNRVGAHPGSGSTWRGGGGEGGGATVAQWRWGSDGRRCF
jgi:hypothetical protein